MLLLNLLLLSILVILLQDIHTTFTSTHTTLTKHIQVRDANKKIVLCFKMALSARTLSFRQSKTYITARNTHSTRHIISNDEKGWDRKREVAKIILLERITRRSTPYKCRRANDKKAINRKRGKVTPTSIWKKADNKLIYTHEYTGHERRREKKKKRRAG